MKNSLKIALAVLSILVLALIAFIYLNRGNFWFSENSDTTNADASKAHENSSEQTTSAQIPVFNSVFDGLKLKTPETYVIASIVENHPDSRPQQMGLSQASIVYEALAEGGITRFLAIFSHDLPEQIGPVRSARPYFVELADQFGAIFLHAGGSQDGLVEIKNNPKVLGLDGLVYEGINYFIRAKKYKAPHNLFVLTEDIVSALPTLQWKFSLNTPFLHFSDRQVLDGTSVQSFSVDFSYPQYKISYEYDGSKGKYKRYMNGFIHRDKGNEQAIEPSNIGIIFTHYHVYDYEGRLDLVTVGSGDFWFFRDGTLIKGQWKRSKQAMMIFEDMDGNLLQFKPGQTFFEIVDSPQKVVYK